MVLVAISQNMKLKTLSQSNWRYSRVNAWHSAQKCITTMPSPALCAETEACMHGKGGANLVTGKMGGHAGPLEILWYLLNHVPAEMGPAEALIQLDHPINSLITGLLGIYRREVKSQDINWNQNLSHQNYLRNNMAISYKKKSHQIQLPTRIGNSYSSYGKSYIT